MSSILTFSDQAKTRLKEIMSSDEYKNALGLRISVKSGGCAGMTYDMNYVEQLIDGDEKIEVEGVNVFIDPKAIMYLLGTEMDYKVDKFTSSFVFNNPNETERCGCGESFKI
ncbi:MAG: iron-sulfur cluster assembly accessory protein [Pelagibacteraceae bacterium]|tara:strand:+ start:314 stop:649 length:336 start_codon:yes stop_codon:yes gene_type:complete